MSSTKISDRKRYWQFLWRSWAIQDSWNYERQMNMGFLFGIAPTLDRLYPDEKDPQQLASITARPRPVPSPWAWPPLWRSNTPPTGRTSIPTPSTL